MNFIIDHREKDLKSVFTTATFENLDLGDIKFTYQNQIFLLIERKKLPDLIASVDDGRYRNQKKRLLESNIPRNRILYLLEGSIDEVPGKMKTVFGMIINTLYRDQIPVLIMNSYEETLYFLKRMKEKLEKKDPALLSSFTKANSKGNSSNTDTNVQSSAESNTEYLSTIKLKKKDNLTPRNCSILQLAQIPGLSINTSTLIIDKYTSISKLILEYQNKTLKEQQLMLSNLEIKTSTGKTRKLGPTLSQRVHQYLTNDLDLPNESKAHSSSPS